MRDHPSDEPTAEPTDGAATGAWVPREWVRVNRDCAEDPDFPGLCLVHETWHGETKVDPWRCEHRVVLRQDDWTWRCFSCPQRFVLGEFGPT